MIYSYLGREANQKALWTPLLQCFFFWILRSLMFQRHKSFQFLRGLKPALPRRTYHFGVWYYKPPIYPKERAFGHRPGIGLRCRNTNEGKEMYLEISTQKWLSWVGDTRIPYRHRLRCFCWIDNPPPGRSSTKNEWNIFTSWKLTPSSNVINESLEEPL